MSPVGRARPPPAPLRSRPPQPARVAPGSVAEAGITAEAAAQIIAEETKKVNKRKYILWAVGAAVITVAGSILGARVKEAKQENDRRNEIKAAAEELVAGASNQEAKDHVAKQSVAEVPAQIKEEVKRALSTPAPAASTASNQPTRRIPYPLEVAKQIALLEDRKALLNRERAKFEGKIQMLRERQVKKAEMEARRGGPQQDTG